VRRRTEGHGSPGGKVRLTKCTAKPVVAIGPAYAVPIPRVPAAPRDLHPASTPAATIPTAVLVPNLVVIR
jgi:hypothetical protein